MTTFVSNCNKCSITGNVPHFHIRQPPTDVVRFVSLNATVSMICSINITIPPSDVMAVEWTHNRNVFNLQTADITTAGKATTLVIENFQPSDVGVYQCQFTDKSINGWTQTRNIRLIIGSKFVCTTCYACNY